MNGNMSDDDKRELILFLIQKIFCVGQQQYVMSPINKEYIVLVNLLATASPVDRNLFVNELKSIFNGRQNVTQVVFQNLIKVVTAIYDSYVPEEVPHLDEAS